MQDLSTNHKCPPEPSFLRQAGKYIERRYKALYYRLRRTLSHASIPYVRKCLLTAGRKTGTIVST